MNKLIKFVSLVAILSSDLSLYAMEQDTSRDITPLWSSAGGGICHIQPQQFLLVCCIDGATLHTGEIEEIEGNLIGYEKARALCLAKLNGQQITFDFLQKHNLINVVFANAATCNKNSALLKDLTNRYIPNFKNDSKRYEDLAKDIIWGEEFSNVTSLITPLKKTVRAFFKNYSFPSAFLFSLSNLSVYEEEKERNIYVTYVTMGHNKPSFLSNELYIRIRFLVTLAMERYTTFIYTLRNYSTIQTYESGFNPYIETSLIDRALGWRQTNVDIVIYTMCEMRELLNAIDNVLASESSREAK